MKEQRQGEAESEMGQKGEGSVWGLADEGPGLVRGARGGV